MLDAWGIMIFMQAHDFTILYIKKYDDHCIPIKERVGLSVFEMRYNGIPFWYI